MKKLLIPILLFILLFLTNSGKGQGLNGIADTPWPMYQHDPQHTGQSPFLGPVQAPELLWVEKVSDCFGENGGLSITDTGSILASLGGCLQSFDPYTRQVEWTYPYGDNSRSTALVRSDGDIFWGYGNVIASISQFGAKNWEAALDANYVFGSSPTFAPDGNLYFVHDGIWSFTTSGSPRWFYPYGTLGFSHASPAIDHNGIIYAPGGHDLTAYQSDGSVAWSVDTPFNTTDDTPVIGPDGTIYVPAADAIVAVSSTGVVDWTYQPPEINDGLQVSHISVAQDSSLRSYVSWFHSSSFIYALDSLGQTLWKTEIFTNTLTGEDAYSYYPMTIDQGGNTYFCADNSRCYGIDADGSVMWEYEFPLVDSIIISASSQPILADNGLFFVTDNYHRLYAFADPNLYPILRTPKENFSFELEVGAQPFTLTIPITSTVSPISYTISVTQTNWITTSSEITGVTPSEIELLIDPASLVLGEYKSSLLIQPQNQIGKWLDLSFELKISAPPDPPNPNLKKRVFLPFVKKGGISHPNKILHFSKWFTEHQFAVIDPTGQNREVITNHLPNQVDRVIYSPDGQKAALVVYLGNGHQIVIIDTVTGDMVLEIIEPGNNDYPSWSPDSQRIVFWSNRDDEDRGEIYSVYVDGSGLKRLTNNTLYESELYWSPTGDMIAVGVGVEGYQRTYIMQTNGGDLHELIPGQYAGIPAGWSDDGRYFLTLENNYSGSKELWVYDFFTSSYTMLADYVSYYYPARWAPNEYKIAYTGLACELNCRLEIFVTDLSGNSVNVTNNPSSYSQIAWSPDGEWLAFVETIHNEDADIFVMRQDGSDRTQITSNTQNDEFPAWQQYP